MPDDDKRKFTDALRRHASSGLRAVKSWLSPDDFEPEEGAEDMPVPGEKMHDRLLRWWHTLVPDFHPLEGEDDPDEPAYSQEYDFDYEQSDDRADAPSDAPARSIPELRRPRFSLTGAGASRKPERLRGGSKKRAPNIHSPYARRVRILGASEPLVISNMYNTLQWSRAQGLLVISETTAQDAEGLVLETASVEVSARLLTERVIPVLVGIMEAIDGAPPPVEGERRRVRRSDRARHRETSAPWWEKDLPYMVESGQNTFIWYRASKKLQVSREKYVDDRGLMLNAKSVILHVDALDASAKGIFEEMLNIRGFGGSFLAGMARGPI